MDWGNALETLPPTLLMLLLLRVSASLWLLHGGLVDRDVGLGARMYKGYPDWHRTGRADHSCRTTSFNQYSVSDRLQGFSQTLTLTLRILQASHALRSLVLVLSMGETMTQWSSHTFKS